MTVTCTRLAAAFMSFVQKKQNPKKPVKLDAIGRTNAFKEKTDKEKAAHIHDAVAHLLPPNFKLPEGMKWWVAKETKPGEKPKPVQNGKVFSFAVKAWNPHGKYLWDLIFPGIERFEKKSNERLAFLYCAQVDAYQIKPLFAKTKTLTASASTTGFNSKSWKSRLVDGKIDLADLIGDRDPDLKTRGRSSLKNTFRGFLPLENALLTNAIDCGMDTARSVVDNRLLVSIDPGSVNLAGILFMFGIHN